MTERFLVPDLSRSNLIFEILRGFMLPLRAFALILTNRRLLRLGLASGLITGVCLITMAIGLWPLSSHWSEQLVSGDSVWKKGAQLGLTLVLYLCSFIVGALTLPNLLLAPLADPISEATELACGDFEPPPFTVRSLMLGTATSLTHTVLRVVLMFAGVAILWPVNFVPVLGGVVWFILSSLWSMFWLSVEHLSTPTARHLHSFFQVTHVLRRRLALTIGFGAALWLLLFIPIINFFLLPIAVIAGTLLYRGLLRTHDFPARYR